VSVRTLLCALDGSSSNSLRLYFTAYCSTIVGIAMQSRNL